jgi:UDP-N-acetylmuramyl pentapeptide phosphotransferase/UDP-N-acetylglucosamine-1-phosphate transferase
MTTVGTEPQRLGGRCMGLLYVIFAAGLLGWGLTGLVLLAAERARHVAEPTDRGLHKTPTPVGGGLGLIGGALFVWTLLDRLAHPLGWPVLAAIALLAAVSWIDDRKPQPPALRFAAQAVAVAIVLWHIPASLRVWPALPLELERFGLLIGWMWMINLTNFMDGIDGIAGMEAIAIGVGYALVSRFTPGAALVLGHLPELALMLAAAAGGYLAWNWAPARIFMGDVGSIPLGLLFGLLMLDLAVRGQWAAALILPLYFLADTSLTLFERLRRGSKPWQAHREHAYQRAVLAGMGHDAVTLHVAALNAALVALAVLSIRHPWPALAAAAALTFALRTWLASRMPAPAARPVK